MRLGSWAARLDWIAHVAKAALQNHHQDLVPRLAPLIPKDGVVLDVGAHSGQFAKLFSRLAPQGRVFAFEPGSYARSVLVPALKVAALGNIELVPMGLSDESTSLTLHMPIKKHGGYGFGLSHLGPEDTGRDTVDETIALTTLDDFVLTRKLKRLDFIKADIEGWEVRMLRGALKAIAEFKPVLMLELTDHTKVRSGLDPQEAWSMLTPLGYNAKAFLEGTPTPRYSGPNDYLFLPAT